MGAGTVMGAWAACGNTVYGTSFDPYAPNPYTTYSTYLDRFNRPLKTQWVMDNTSLSATSPAFDDLEMVLTRVPHTHHQPAEPTPRPFGLRECQPRLADSLIWTNIPDIASIDMVAYHHHQK